MKLTSAIKIICLNIFIINESQALDATNDNRYLEMTKVMRENKNAKQYDDLCASRRQFSIYGGSDTKLGDAPYQVSLRRYGTTFNFCGGGLITLKYILTAAHCFLSSGRPKKRLSQVTATVGTVTRQFSPTQQSRRVKEAWIHNKYKTKSVFNDIAIAEVNYPFVMTKYVNVIRMAGGGTDFATVGRKCLLSGFGMTPVSNLPAHMKSVCMSIKKIETCARVFGRDVLSNTQLCCGNRMKDSCNGDSGGLLVCNGVASGIVSFGMRECGVQPGVYTKIKSFTTSRFVKLAEACADRTTPSNFAMATLIMAVRSF